MQGAACRWHANERRSHLPIRSVLPVCHWQTAPEPAGETAGAAPPFVLRCARRSAKQKKAVPAKNSEAIFWRPRFTWPLRAGKRANANFACSEGLFCAQCAARSAAAVAFAKPAAVVAAFAPGALVCPPCALVCLVLVVCLPFLCLCAHISLLSLSFFCLTSSSQNFFHLSLRPRRASTFFRKESRQRFARGAARRSPSNPSDGALRPIFSSSALLAGLSGLSGRKPPADGETLEKPRSRAQLFKRFCAKGDACALSPISPFLSVLAGLTALRAANRRLAGKRPKSQGAKLSFSGVSVRGGTFGPTFYVFMEIWRGLFDRRASRPQGTETRLSPRPGKQKLSVGLHPERTACVRSSNADTNTVRELPAAGAGLRRTFSSYLSPFSVWLLPLNFLFTCRSGRDGPLLSSEKKVDKDSRGARCAGGTRISADRAGRRDRCPFEPHSCALRPIFFSSALLAGLSGHSAANRRQIRETPEKPKEQSSAFRAFLCKGGRLHPFADLPPFSGCWPAYAAFQAANRRLAWETPEKPRSKAQLFGRFCAWGTRRGFSPVRENRSRARARTRNQPRACETRRRKRQGAPLCGHPPHKKLHRG